jgi:hypothetical protein
MPARATGPALLDTGIFKRGAVVADLFEQMVDDNSTCIGTLRQADHSLNFFKACGRMLMFEAFLRITSAPMPARWRCSSAGCRKWFYELMELGYSLVAYRRMVKAIREHKPDCIYERYNLFLPAGIWAARRYKLPLLLEVNAPILEERSRYDGLSLTGWRAGRKPMPGAKPTWCCR